MARNRIIKPEFWADAKIGRLSFGARLLYIAMWNFADDYGIISASPRQRKCRKVLTMNHVFAIFKSLSFEHCCLYSWLSQARSTQFWMSREGSRDLLKAQTN